MSKRINTEEGMPEGKSPRAYNTLVKYVCV